MVQFWALDKNFVKTAELKATNIQWRPRYYECGDFEILMPKASYDPDMAYIWKVGTGQVGIIQDIEYTVQAEGPFITLAGYFTETWLSRGVILEPAKPDNTLPANIIDVVKNMVQSRIINDLNLSSLIEMGEFVSLAENVAGCDENEFEVGQIAFSLLKSFELAQRLRFDYDAKKFYYDIYQGVDRSIKGPNQVLFSDSAISSNISQIQYSNDISDYKNFAHIRIDRGEERIITSEFSLAKEGEDLNKIMVQFSDTESETDAQAIEAGQQQALLDLLNHKKIVSISFEPTEQAFEYQKDYDMGDKVNLTIHALGLSYGERIIGVDETYKNNTQSLKLHFGDEKKMNYVKAGW